MPYCLIILPIFVLVCLCHLYQARRTIIKGDIFSVASEACDVMARMLHNYSQQLEAHSKGEFDLVRELGERFNDLNKEFALLKVKEDTLRAKKPFRWF